MTARAGSVLGRGAGWLGMAVALNGILNGGPALASDPSRDRDGFFVHTVGNNEIRVLIPDGLEQGARVPVVYVLPVEARNGSRYGDGLFEVRKHDLHNRFRAIFVAPTFPHLPWYADHPTNPQIRQEHDFVDGVVPFIERQYPARTDRDGRLLLGFSKSGWGAFSLLLRHPDLFGKAAAWDAPLMQERPDRYGMGEIFGTQTNFDDYRITTLLEHRAAELRGKERLILLGYGNFRDHHQKAHAWMVDHEIPHVYHDGPKREHIWESGWVAEAVELLLGNPP